MFTIVIMAAYGSFVLGNYNEEKGNLIKSSLFLIFAILIQFSVYKVYQDSAVLLDLSADAISVLDYGGYAALIAAGMAAYNQMRGETEIAYKNMRLVFWAFVISILAVSFMVDPSQLQQTVAE